jgi:DNA mismatch repair protein MutL
LAKARPSELVKDLLDLLSDKEKIADESRLMEDVLNMAACKAAIKAGQRLNDNEIEQLLADREKLEQAGRCPHGRPTMIKFSRAELEKQFKRT